MPTRNTPSAVPTTPGRNRHRGLGTEPVGKSRNSSEAIAIIGNQSMLVMSPTTGATGLVVGPFLYNHCINSSLSPVSRNNPPIVSSSHPIALRGWRDARTAPVTE